MAVVDGTGRPDQDVVDLLAAAAAAVHQDPAAAAETADLVAARTTSPVLLARAHYVQAQVRALRGDLGAALGLVDLARAGLEAAGRPTEALRTELGRMHVLNEMGRHEEAVAVGRTVLARLAEEPAGPGAAGTTGGEDEEPDGPDRDWLRATVHRNLAPCYALVGRHARALEESRAAEEIYRDTGHDDEVAAVRHSVGEQLLDLGRVREAVDELAAARDAFRDTGQTLSEARCLVDLGRASVLLGRWSDGLATLATARELLDRLDVRPEVDQLLLGTAETWLGLGLHEEALTVYREAEESLRRSGQPHYLARVLLGEGAALARAGRLADAHDALGEASRLYREADNVPLLAQVALENADVHERGGDRTRARACAAEAVALLEGSEWESQLLHARLRAVDLALPDLDAAEAHLTRARHLAARLGLPPLQQRVDARTGHLRRLAGDDAGARRHLHASVAVVERLRAGLPSDLLRTAFLRDAAAPYADLVALELSAGEPEAALEAAERSKSRSLMDLMTGPRTRLGGQDAARRPDALAAELAASYNELLGTDGAGSVEVRARRVRSLREHVRRLEGRLSERSLRAGGAGTADAGAPLALPELLRRLPADLAVLCYHVVDDEVVAFVLSGQEVRGVRAVTTLGRLRPLLRRLDAQWQRFRVGALVDRHRHRLRSASTALLQELHEELLAPLGDLPGTARLAVVPHGPLHEVPFHALHDGRRWLLERFEVSVAPSLGVLATAVRREPATGPALVLGVPDEAVRAVTEEAGAVAGTLPGARLRLGPEATVAALRAEAPGSSVVHVACHGLFRPESPAYSALRLADTWLTAAELGETDLTGSLVALTACETGRSHARGPGDEVLGLTRAALGAGATAVLVSLWLVQDDAASGLVTRWYQRLADGAGAAAALRDVQLELAVSGEHPYHWAPFVLVGDPDAAPGRTLPTRPAPAPT